jgi:hypothetical protein
MPRKTKIIFIVSFIVVIALGLGFYYYANKNKTATSGSTADSSYKPFFGGSTTTKDNTTTDNNTNGTQTGDATNTQTEQTGTSFVETSKFTKIADFAVAGATFFEDQRPLPIVEKALEGGEIPPEQKAVDKKIDTKTKKTVVKKPEEPKFEIVPSIRYVERVTGHIYQMYLDTKTSGKVSNSTVPGIYEAIFDGSATGVIYRYLDETSKSITTFFATLGGDKGEFLPSDILDVSISPDKTKFFYLTKSSNGVVGTIRNFKDGKRNQVFNSSLSEWLTQWVGDQKVYLTTKASANFSGSVFSLNIANGVLTKIFGGINGLTTLGNKDGVLVLYSSSIAGGPRLGIFDVKNRTTKQLDVYSLPEKCTWSADQINVYCAVPNNIQSGDYPDDWYQGLVTFNDRFVKINANTGQINIIGDSSSYGGFDATHLFMDKIEGKIFFINKKDSTLWSLDLLK